MSSFEESDTGSSKDSTLSSLEEFTETLDPTAFEPIASPSSYAAHNHLSGGVSNGRHGNLAWCRCSNCSAMPTDPECLCCLEVDVIRRRLREENSHAAACITQHPGFTSVCLDVWVLETAYYGYRQEYGTQMLPGASPQQKLRHTAYRNFVRWIWGWCGKQQRKILPSCVVMRIRERFSSDSYTGFKFAFDL